VCGETPSNLPRFVALDRRGFVDANLIIARRLLDPVEQLRAKLPDSRASDVARRMMDRYVGELFGLMSRRVLGQYDPVLMLGAAAESEGETPSLYLVEPNLVAFEREHGLPGEPLRRWLILHELTHAWQFEAHPWLGDYITTQMREMLMSGIAASDGQSFLQSREMLQRLPDTIRTQLRGVGRLQAVMSVLEGYSNFVMHRVGRRHIEHAEQLEAAAERRRKDRNALERLVLAITGLEMKMRQYAVGERFATIVTDAAGLEVLNRVWDGPESLPTMDELRHPRRWLTRIR
ncbi:MAG TPA: zinc-dependent metalloprotease, partial [Candidatus Dormibacteraeota bacterium]|nr:zinc-dependent metalloprotease [Candidatus Dormibacteraeota bacterium]